eukprot:PhF_6_TR20829/c0_g1_i1/m.29986
MDRDNSRKSVIPPVCLCHQLGCGSCSAVFEGRTSPPTTNNNNSSLSTPLGGGGGGGGGSMQGTVAVKVFPKEKAEHGYSEYEILRRIRHPGCVTPYAIQRTETGDVYLLMELVRGPDMVALLEKSPKGIVSEAVARHLVRSVASAMAYLHNEANIVHLDIKMENILVIPETLETKLIDFHLSKRYDPTMGDLVTEEHRFCENAGSPASLSPIPSPKHVVAPCCNKHAVPTPKTGDGGVSSCHCDDTRVHSTHHHHDAECTEHTDCKPFHCAPCGSLKYAPPEVIEHLLSHGMEPRTVTWPDLQRVDVFGLGVVTYGLLTGSFPYYGVDKPLLLQQMNAGPRLRGRLLDRLSPQCLDFIKTLLNPNVSQRPSANEILQHSWLTTPDPSPLPRLIMAITKPSLGSDPSSGPDDMTVSTSTPTTTPVMKRSDGEAKQLQGGSKDTKGGGNIVGFSAGGGGGLDRQEDELHKLLNCRKCCIS